MQNNVSKNWMIQAVLFEIDKIRFPTFSVPTARKMCIETVQSLQLESDLSPQLFSQNKSTLQLTNAKLIISK